MKKKSAAVLLTCFGLMTTTPAMNPEAERSRLQFRALADHYFSDVVFHFGPTNATQIGFHQYDTKLEDYSRAGVESEIAALRGYEQKFDSFPAAGLDESTQGDLAIMRDNIKGNLLELETIRGWEKNPDNYSSGITNSAFVLMERDFAPVDERLRSLIAREKQMPAVFTAARQNLKNPPRIYTEIALEQLPDIISFFQHDVPDAFKAAKIRQRLPNSARPTRSDCCTGELPGLAEERSAAEVQWRFSHRRGHLQQEATLRRDGRHAAGPPAADWV